MLRVIDEEKEGPNRYCGGIYQLWVEVIYMKFSFSYEVQYISLASTFYFHRLVHFMIL